MSAPGDFEGAMAQAQVRALKEQAQALGLTWSLTIGTAVDTASGQPMAVCDGDSEAIAVTSMIGVLYGGMRVWIMRVPPSGNYVIGLVDAPLLGIENINTHALVFSTTSATFVNMAVTSMSFTKAYTDTALALRMSTTGYSDAGGIEVETGLFINGADYNTASLYYNPALTHLTISGTQHVPPGVPAGTYTIVPRVRLISGATAWNTGTDDYCSYEVEEIRK